ncbi:glycosyltransferase family 2 protein [uncultured Clostridium sp.]|uniref:glycosyltransferase family 2 protein n=1 Tax=uncultured Clostridium sp. TaxID=59620 RepID=UPI0025D7FBFF|nr:glycosyltransferase family 2 protein [uncultured Clostridium sp.]
MIKVSVIIPVYNVEKDLSRCLKSVLNQTMRDIEVILINDGSSDNSLEVCRNFKKIDSRIIVVDKKNEGPSKARNIGIEIAKGKYITFVDSDDWIEKEMFENMYNNLEKEQCDICISNYYRNYQNKEIKVNLDFNDEILTGVQIREKLIFPLIGRKEFGAETQILGFGAPWGKLFKKSFIKKNNIFFNNSLLIGEDTLFNIQALAKTNKVIIDNKHYYHYWDNENSIMRRYKENCWDIYKSSILKIDEFLKNYNWQNIIEERFNIMKIEAIIRSIRNECSPNNNKSLKNKLCYISRMCSDHIITDTLKNIDFNKLSLKRKCILKMIEYKFSGVLYFLLK